MCPERKRLTDELGDALKWIITLTTKELEAVIDGRAEDSADLQTAHARAVSLRDEFKQKLAEHRHQHGC